MQDRGRVLKHQPASLSDKKLIEFLLTARETIVKLLKPKLPRRTSILPDHREVERLSSKEYRFLSVFHPMRGYL